MQKFVALGYARHECDELQSYFSLRPPIVAPEIGFDPTSYSYDEAAGVARLTITTNMPLRFTDATGALFYTEDGTATGGGGIATRFYSTAYIISL